MKHLTPMIREAREIVRNVKAAVTSGEITQAQADEIIRQTLEHVAQEAQIGNTNPAPVH